MTSTEPKTYGPWTVAAEATPLHHVIYANGTATSVVPTTEAGWVLKIMTAPAAIMELSETLMIYAETPRNAVEFPDTVGALCGTATPDTVWIAMRRYTGSAATEREYCRTHWRRLAAAVLAFLEDVHVGTRHVHGDLKAGNVLVDVVRGEFVVADFGHMDLPSTKLTQAYSSDHLWYYLAMGAEPDQTPRGWRADLTALGYLLADLTWPEEVSCTFHAECMARRGLLGSNDTAMHEIAGLRDVEMSRACGLTLRTYFETLASEVAWDAVRPPPRALYRALAVLFT